MEDGGLTAGKGVGGEVDGFGGAGSDADGGGVEAEPGGECLFQRVGFGLGIIADGVEPRTEMRLQRREIHVTIDIRAEIRPDGPPVAVCVVPVPLNHRFPFRIS